MTPLTRRTAAALAVAALPASALAFGATSASASVPSSVTLASAPAALPASRGGGTPHGYCSFTAGSTRVTVRTTHTGPSVVKVDVYAGKPVHLQPVSYGAWPKLYLRAGYGTHIVRYDDEVFDPSFVHIRATRGGRHGSCDAPIPSRIGSLAATGKTVNASDPSARRAQGPFAETIARRAQGPFAVNASTGEIRSKIRSKGPVVAV